MLAVMKWAGRSLVQANKEKGRVLPLAGSSPRHQGVHPDGEQLDRKGLGSCWTLHWAGASNMPCY